MAAGHQIGSLRWSVRALTAVVWASMIVFAVYIIAFFGGQLLHGDLSGWNDALGDLFTPDKPLRTASIGIHFAAGTILLLFGPLQFLEVIRRRLTWLHRTIGSFYALAAFLAGISGLAFIALGGTVGGPVMNVGFAGYGLSMAVCGLIAPLAAIRGQFDQHRAWVIRLFALAIGSWLFRIEYGFFFALLDGAGHQRDFRGPLDQIMAFAFYVPNLAVAEWLIRHPISTWPQPGQRALAAGLVPLTGLLALGSLGAVAEIWWPEILTHGPELLGRD